jgi:hypothetical protein
VLLAVQEKYGQWNFFKYFAKRNILDVEAELNGKKKIPQAAAALGKRFEPRSFSAGTRP